MFEVLYNLSLPDILRIVAEIFILTFVFYRMYSAMSNTRVIEVLGVSIGLVILYLLSEALGLIVITKILRVIAVPFVMLVCVIYHAELRRIFTGVASGRSGLFKIGEQTTGEEIDTILNACNILVEKERGALIIFPRRTDIHGIYESGTRLDAELTSSLILTVFDHDTPLHDGAMVIIGGRIAWAACYLPLSEQKEIKSSFGTRHRAALGLAEESDAVILIVSEENGAISLAYNANIYYNLSTPVIKKTLQALLTFNDVMPVEEEDER